MSKKSLVLLIVAAFALSLGMGVSMSLAEADKGPAEIVLGADGKKPITFMHAKHQAKLECADCHHKKGDDGAQAPLAEGDAVAKCDSCHNKDFANEKLRTWKKIGHKLCKDCHKAKKGEEGVPGTKCADCHPKKK